MAVAAAFALVVVAFAVVAAIAAAALVRHMVEHVLYLLVGGIAVLKDYTLELQRLPGKGVVRVYGDAVGIDLHHTCHEATLVGIHQRDDGSWVDVLAVEAFVDGEHIAFEHMNTLGIVLAEGIGGRKGEVERVARGKASEALLEAVEGEAEAADKREGLTLLCLLLKMGGAVRGYGIELIAH
jgi:hypothetical protein